MITRLTVISAVVLFTLLFVAVSAFAAPSLQEPVIPPLHDCQCVDEYQANMWQYHPVLDNPVKAELPPVATMAVDCCQDVATHQANLWQLEQID